MKKMRVLSTILSITLLTIIILPACQLFLGPDPDDSPRGIFDTIWNDFDKTYALFEHKNIDWKGVYNEFSPHVTPNMTQAELYSLCIAMLSRLMDDHVWVWGPNMDYKEDPRWPETKYHFSDEFNTEVFRRGTYVNFPGEYDIYENMSYGRFTSNPEIGYIRISTFTETTGIFMETGDWAKEIDNVLQALSDTKGLVLDIRQNNGGFPANHEYIANRFAAKEANYMSVSTKNGPGRNDFSTPLYRTIKPEGTRYTKPVVMLTNNTTISCAEMFALALLTQDHVTHVGSNTQGALCVRIVRPLINGWEYTVSIQRALDMNGKSLERKSLTEAGITPEYLIPAEIIIDWEAQTFIDEQLEGAFDILITKIP